MGPLRGISAFWLLLCVVQGAEASPSMTTTAVKVDTVKTVALQTFPIQIQVIITGRKLAGVAVQMRQQRIGKDVVVTMTQISTPGAEVRLVPFTEQLLLEGGFAVGTYTLRINDYRTSFEVS